MMTTHEIYALSPALISDDDNAKHFSNLKAMYSHFDQVRGASDHSDHRSDEQLDQVCNLLRRQLNRQTRMN